MKKGVDERVSERFSHLERMENVKIGKRVYEGECMGSRPVVRPRKRWIDSVNVGCHSCMEVNPTI